MHYFQFSQNLIIVYLVKELVRIS